MTPTPALKAPPGPVRQLSGAFSPPRPGALVRANSSGPQGGIARAASGAFSPPLRTASLGGAGSGSFGPEGPSAQRLSGLLAFWPFSGRATVSTMGPGGTSHIDAVLHLNAACMVVPKFPGGEDDCCG